MREAPAGIRTADPFCMQRMYKTPAAGPGTVEMWTLFVSTPRSLSCFGTTCSPGRASTCSPSWSVVSPPPYPTLSASRTRMRTAPHTWRCSGSEFWSSPAAKNYSPRRIRVRLPADCRCRCSHRTSSRPVMTRTTVRPSAPSGETTWTSWDWHYTARGTLWTRSSKALGCMAPDFRTSTCRILPLLTFR